MAFSLGRGPNSPMPNIVESQPDVEEYDLPEAVADSELEVAERLLAGLLVHSWLARHQDCPDAQHGLGPKEHHAL